MVDDDKIEIETIDGSSNKDKQSFKSIVLEQYRLCCVAGSKEMVSGGVATRYVNNEKVEYIIPDQIQIFINHIDMLKYLLLPKLMEHSDVVGEDFNKFEKDLDMLDKNRKQLLKTLNINFNKLSNRTNPNGVSEKSSHLPVYKRDRQVIETNYMNRKITLYKESLFATLCLLLAKLNYFDTVF